MSMTDPIADYLTKIRNAIQAKKKSVDIKASNLKRDITQILLEQGYICRWQRECRLPTAGHPLQSCLAIETNMGEITIEFSTTTPNTVENFTKLAKAGFYNGTKFHRVIKGFMNQGGDPLSKEDSQKQLWGTGGPGYKFDDELGASNKNDVGTISMANSGPNTNGSQFFINVAPNNFLDTKHTVFGKVISGMDVVTAINNTPTDGSDKPLTPVILESITLK